MNTGTSANVVWWRGRECVYVRRGDPLVIVRQVVVDFNVDKWPVLPAKMSSESMDCAGLAATKKTAWVMTQISA
jgi:hypothetical protein